MDQLFPGRKILIISHICPYPAHSGVQARIGQTLEWLRKVGFEVWYVFQAIDPVSKSARAELGRHVDRLIVVRQHSLGKSIYQSLRRALGWVLSRLLPSFYERVRAKPSAPSEPGSFPKIQYGEIEALCWPATVQLTESLAKTFSPDFVLSELGIFSRCLEAVPADTIKLLDTHELYSQNHDLLLAAGVRPGFVCTEANEQSALRRADALIAIQGTDRKVLEKWFPDKTVLTLRHGYDGKISAGRTKVQTGKILYVAGDNLYNRHGLAKFLADVWPAVVAKCAESELHLAGSLSVDAAAHPGKVLSLGRISDEALAEAYGTCNLVINPQLAGTGLKIKCVEALAHACPLVTYSAGAEGLEDGRDRAFLLATSPSEFAEAVVKLIRDPALRQSLENGAQTFAREHLSSEAVFREFKDYLADNLR